MAIVVKLEMDVFGALVVEQVDALAGIHSGLDSGVHWCAQHEVSAAWLDKDGQDKGTLHIGDLLKIKFDYFAEAQILGREVLLQIGQLALIVLAS